MPSRPSRDRRTISRLVASARAAKTWSASKVAVIYTTIRLYQRSVKRRETLRRHARLRPGTPRRHRPASSRFPAASPGRADHRVRLVALEPAHAIGESLHRDVNRAGHVSAPELRVLADIEDADGILRQESVEL